MNIKSIIESQGLDWEKIASVNINEDGSNVVLSITLKKNIYHCPHCGCVNFNIKEYKIKEFIGLPFGNKNLVIRMKFPRLICKECGKTFQQKISSISKYKISKEVIDSIIEDFYKMKTYQDISKDHGVPLNTILKIFDENMPDLRMDLNEVICVDEFKNLTSEDEDFAFIMVDFNTRKIINILNSRKRFAIEQYFSSIELEKRQKIKYMISDMYDTYISLGKQYFPNAKIAIDPFHYIRYFTEAVQKVRRRITDSDNLTESMKWLKQHRRLLTLSTSNLRKLKVDQQYRYDLEEKINNVVATNSELFIAFHTYQIFINAYEKTFGYEEGKKLILETIKSMKQTQIPEFQDVAKTWSHYKNYIFNSFNVCDDRRLTNGPIEGINSRIKTLKKLCCGYRNATRFYKRIIAIVNNDK